MRQEGEGIPPLSPVLSVPLPMMILAISSKIISESIIQLVAANRAGIVNLQPRHNTIRMINMVAGHLPHLRANLEILLTDGAMRLIGHKGPRNLHYRNRLNRRRRCRRRPRPVVLGQLFDQRIEARSGEEVPGVGGGRRT